MGQCEEVHAQFVAKSITAIEHVISYAAIAIKIYPRNLTVLASKSSDNFLVCKS
jgi:hypothetical protein